MKKLVLIAEDNAELGRFLLAAVKSLEPDLEVRLVPSGEEAILEAHRSPVDLVVADVHLPGISGIDLVKKIRARRPGTKVIVVTGMQDPKLRKQAEEAGAVAFFRKPMEMGTFLDAISVHLHEGETPPPPPQPVVPAPASPTSLADFLTHLRQNLGAQTVLLLDNLGHIAFQSGEVPPANFEAEWASAILTTISAGTRVSSLGKLPQPLQVQAFRGSGFDLVAAPSNDFVLVFLLASGRPALRLALVFEEALQAQQDLLRVLEAMGVPVTPSIVAGLMGEAAAGSVSTQTPPDGPAIDEPVLEDFAALFEQPAVLKMEDVDAFWEHSGEGGNPSPGAPDALTYEQAKKLGFTPDNGEPKE